MTRRVLSLVMAALLLTAAVYRVNPHAAWAALTGVSPIFLLAALVLQTLILLVKARRWAVALRAAAHRPVRGLLSAMLIGFAGNLVLPARLGEIARAHLAAAENHLPRSLVLTTIAITQLFDLLLLGVLLLAVAFFAAAAALVRPAIPLVLLLLGVIGLAALLKIQRSGAAFSPFLRRMTGMLPGSFQRTSAYYASQFATGLQLLGEGRASVRVLLYTLAIWSLEVASYTLALAAFRISVPMLAPALLVVVLSLAFILPLTPANIGPYQFLCVFLLGPFGIAREPALAFSVGLQGACALLVLALGFGALLRAGLTTRTLYRQIASPDARARIPATEVVRHAACSVPRSESSVPAPRSGDPAGVAGGLRELHVLAGSDR